MIIEHKLIGCGTSVKAHTLTRWILFLDVFVLKDDFADKTGTNDCLVGINLLHIDESGWENGLLSEDSSDYR